MAETPELVTTVQEVRARVAQARREGKRIGLVPTMGALHDGHLALMRTARAECGYAVVSIFVNPTQFAPGEDYAKYPRSLEQDAARCGTVGVDLVFAPAVEEMYPPGDSTSVEVTGTLVEGFCGPFRPGHFRGVTTVCARLFHIALPDRAYFGGKDYQQLRVITRMVADLKFPLTITPVPTVRESDGLAMSSRNAYLSSEDRPAATALYRGLQAATARFEAGERETAALLEAVREVVAAEPRVRLQYVEARDAETLARVDRAERPTVIALAAHLGKTRLIDNIVLGR